MALKQEQEVIAVVTAKDTIKKTIMQKDNNLMLGYTNLHDLLSSLFGFKIAVINFIVSVIAIMTSFITNYIWDDAKSIYILLALIAVDAITGICKAIKHKTFSSAKLPRILVIMVAYTALLGIAWNVSKVSPAFSLLPAALYGGFVSTLVISIFENFHELKWIPNNIYKLIKSKLDLAQQAVFGNILNKKSKK